MLPSQRGPPWAGRVVAAVPSPTELSILTLEDPHLERSGRLSVRDGSRQQTYKRVRPNAVMRFKGDADSLLIITPGGQGVGPARNSFLGTRDIEAKLMNDR